MGTQLLPVSRTRTTPWDALLLLQSDPEPVRFALVGDRPLTKVGVLLQALAELGNPTSKELAAGSGMTMREVWNLLKQPRYVGRVHFDDGRWSMAARRGLDQ